MAMHSPAVTRQQQVSLWKRISNMSHTPAWEGSLKMAPPAISPCAAYLCRCTCLSGMSRLSAPSRVGIKNKWL